MIKNKGEDHAKTQRYCPGYCGCATAAANHADCILPGSKGPQERAE